MYGLKIVDGDLSLRDDGRTNLVSGAERVAQDLSCWLLEPVGTDVMYPRFGSALDRYIGSVVDGSTFGDVDREVWRVANNYLQHQQKRRELSQEELTANEYAQVWSRNDVVAALSEAGIGAYGDTISIDIGIAMEDSTTAVMGETI